jgi:hypothetical protein
VAQRCRHEVLERLTAYRDDGEEQALLVYLHPRVLDGAWMRAGERDAPLAGLRRSGG